MLVGYLFLFYIKSHTAGRGANLAALFTFRGLLGLYPLLCSNECQLLTVGSVIFLSLAMWKSGKQILNIVLCDVFHNK